MTRFLQSWPNTWSDLSRRRTEPHFANVLFPPLQNRLSTLGLGPNPSTPTTSPGRCWIKRTTGSFSSTASRSGQCSHGQELTLIRPDILIYSQSRQVMIIWAELTVPLEENVIDAEIRKTKRYLELALRSNDWTVHPSTIEVGSIGWVANSTSRFLRSVGFNRQQSHWIKKQISLSASRSSFLIWCSRFNKKWEKAERTVSANPPVLSESQREALQLLDSIRIDPTEPSSHHN